MKKINISKVNFDKNSLFKFWMFLGFFLAISCLIVGCFLVGFYFNNFLTYYKLAQAWNGGPGFNEYINTHNNTYDSYSDSDYSTWVYASYTLFAVGLGFLLLGFLLLILFICLYKRHKKHIKANPNYDNVNNNQIDSNSNQKETIVKPKKAGLFNKNKKFKTL